MSRAKIKANRLRRILATALCLLCLTTAVYAASGSLKVTVEDAQSGFAICLIPVADIEGVPNDHFAGAGLLPGQITDESNRKAAAEALYAYAVGSSMTPEVVETDSRGVVCFDPLAEGIYLVWEDSDGLDFGPFLVSIPTKLGEQLIYNVEAEPKAEEPEPPPTPTPTPGVTPPPSPGPDIPQTGANMLPIWLLLAFGGASVLAGLALLIFGGKKEVNDEKD